MDENGTRPALYGVGVGPGDPELITIKAVRVLESVQVVCYPEGKGSAQGHAYGIARRYLGGGVESIPLSFPMSRDKDTLRKAWDAASDTVVARLAAGKDVAFLTEGDPLFYSTFIYLADGVGKRLPSARIETVPGVTSLSGCAAAARIPLARAGERVAVIDAPHALDELDDLLGRFDALALMKCAAYLDRIVPALERNGLLDNAVLVELGTRRDQQVLRGRELLLAGKPHYLSTLLVFRRDGRQEGSEE